MEDSRKYVFHEALTYFSSQLALIVAAGSLQLTKTGLSMLGSYQ